MRISKFIQNLFYISLTFFCMSCFGLCGASQQEKADADMDEAMENLEKSSENLEELAENLGKAAEKFGESIGSNAEDFGAEVEEAVKNMGKEGGAPNINFREIKDEIPNKLAGLPRVEIEGESGGAFGFTKSEVNALFEEGGASIEATVLYIGGFGGAFLNLAPWATIDVDKENKDGWERTSNYKGFKIFEKFDKRRNRSEFNAIIDYFVISLKGKGEDVDVDRLRDAFDDLPTRKFKKMSERAREEALEKSK